MEAVSTVVSISVDLSWTDKECELPPPGVQLLIQNKVSFYNCEKALGNNTTACRPVRAWCEVLNVTEFDSSILCLQLWNQWEKAGDLNGRTA